MGFRIHKCVPAVILPLLVSSVAWGAPGDLDTTFGQGGLVATTMNTYGLARSSALQADGKLIIVGNDRMNSGTGSMWAIHRYLTDGSLDPSFGNAGRVTMFGVTQANNFTEAWGVTVDGGTGKIYVIGNAPDPATMRVFIRVVALLSSGSLDTSFNGTGILTIDLSTTREESGRDIKLSPDGHLLLAGAISSLSTQKKKYTAAEIFVAKVKLPGATLDQTFGLQGYSVINVSNLDDTIVANGMAVTSTGAIHVGSRIGTNGWAVSKFAANGALDTSWGTTGIVKTSFPYAQYYPHDLALQANDQVVMGGIAFDSSLPGGSDTLATRYTLSGQLDSTFANGGKFVSGLATLDNGQCLAVDHQSGKVYLGSVYEHSVSELNFVPIRLTGAGAMDSTYGVGGIGALALHTHPTAGASVDSTPRAVCHVDAQGRLVVAAMVVGGTTPIYGAARYLGF